LWYDKDWERPSELEALAHHGLEAGALVFDLGAHQNVIAMMLAKEVSESGKVIAVEGAKHNADVGAANAVLNGFRNLTTIHAVVGAKEEDVNFTQSFNGEVTTNAGGAVSSITIDSLAREFGNPAVVFMDIEGYELFALDGGHETLRRGTTWFIEVHGDETLAKYGGCNRNVVERFASGYKLQFRLTDEGVFLSLADIGLTPKTRFWLLATIDSPAL
jgi:FkbM family methyltransferase